MYMLFIQIYNFLIPKSASKIHSVIVSESTKKTPTADNQLTIYNINIFRKTLKYINYV